MNSDYDHHMKTNLKILKLLAQAKRDEDEAQKDYEDTIMNIAATQAFGRLGLRPPSPSGASELNPS